MDESGTNPAWNNGGEGHFHAADDSGSELIQVCFVERLILVEEMVKSDGSAMRMRGRNNDARCRNTGAPLDLFLYPSYKRTRQSYDLYADERQLHRAIVEDYCPCVKIVVNALRQSFASVEARHLTTQGRRDDDAAATDP
jgi:hypothetical protein